MGGNITSNNEYFYFQAMNTEVLAKYLSCLAVILPLLTVLVKFMLRPRVIANCWFCNKNSRVASKDSNSWYCNHCEQYNGFLPNGDYNKELPEQRFIPSRNGVSYAAKSKFPTESNGLCDKCNTNQEMKVLHLASFEAVVPCNYDEELKIYRNQLEIAYRLCQKCEGIVSATLEKKKGLVLGMRLKQSEKHTFGKLKYWGYSHSRAFHKVFISLALIFSLVSGLVIPLTRNLDSVLLHQVVMLTQSNYWTVLGGSLFVQLLLTLSTGRKLPFIVCLAHTLLYFGQDQKGSADGTYLLGFVGVLTFLLTLLSLRRVRRGAFIKLQKIENPSLNVRPQGKEQVTDLPEMNVPVPTFVKARSPTPQPEETKPERAESAVVPTIPEPLIAKPITTEPPAQTSLPTSQDDNSSVDSAFSNHDSATQDSDSVKGDVNDLIQSLNLGSQWSDKLVAERPRVGTSTSSTRHEFLSRRYGENNKPLLNPPRLVSGSPRSLNESSWVAGGFWQKQQGDESFTECPSPPRSRSGSPSPSIHSQASAASAWQSTTSRPGSPFQVMGSPPMFPVFTPQYGPPNGFQQPIGYQPFMYASPMGLWNPNMFQQMSPRSSSSCSSASTCSSVRRNASWDRSDADRDFSSFLKPKRFNLFRALWQNSSVILYTSAFYVAVSACAVILYQKW